jgi:hypothetical protein
VAPHRCRGGLVPPPPPCTALGSTTTSLASPSNPRQPLNPCLQQAPSQTAGGRSLALWHIGRVEDLPFLLLNSQTDLLVKQFDVKLQRWSCALQEKKPNLTYSIGFCYGISGVPERYLKVPNVSFNLSR